MMPAARTGVPYSRAKPRATAAPDVAAEGAAEVAEAGPLDCAAVPVGEEEAEELDWGRSAVVLLPHWTDLHASWPNLSLGWESMHC